MSIDYKIIAISEECFPLSLQEQALYRMVMRNREEGVDCDYNITAKWRIRGSVDRRCMERVVNDMIAAHVNLRAAFLGPNRKVIRDTLPSQEIGTHIPDGKVEFDITRPPLLKVFVEERRGRSTMLLAVHHLAADGRSSGKLVFEMLCRYSLSPFHRVLSWFPLTRFLVPAPNDTVTDTLSVSREQKEILNKPSFHFDVQSLIDHLNPQPIQSAISEEATVSEWRVNKASLVAIQRQHKKLSLTNLFQYLLGLSIKETTEAEPLFRVLRSGQSPFIDYSATAYLWTTMGCSTIPELHAKSFRLRTLLKRLEFLDKITAEELIRDYNRETNRRLTIDVEVNYLTPSMTDPPVPILSKALRQYCFGKRPEEKGLVTLGVWKHVDQDELRIYDPLIVLTVRDDGRECLLQLSSRYPDYPAEALLENIQRIMLASRL